MSDGTPIKLCECGCGEPAPIAKITKSSRGVRKGDPQRFVAGHQTRVPVSVETRAKQSASHRARQARKPPPGPCKAPGGCDNLAEIGDLCSPHYQRFYRHGRFDLLEVRPSTGRPMVITNFDKGVKLCGRCQQWKPLADFGKSKGRGGGGWIAYCRPCNAELQRERRRLSTPEQKAKRRESHQRWRANNPHLIQQNELRCRVKRMGITVERWEALIQEQCGRCAICQFRPKKATSLAIDHDHVTGDVRGLLCAACNTAIGLLKDDPLLMKRAASYMKRAKGGGARCASLVAVFDSNPKPPMVTSATLF